MLLLKGINNVICNVVFNFVCNVVCNVICIVSDHCILLQPFTSQAQNGNIRIKPNMVQMVAGLYNKYYDIVYVL